MITESFLENLSIYHDNLSVYYLGSLCITVLSVLMAWWYNYSFNKSQSSDKADKPTSNSIYEEPVLDDDCVSNDAEQDIKNKNTENDVSIVTLKIKSTLADKVAANLTEDQLKEEREVEKQQLAAIFQLLQNQEDKFQVSSLEDLEDQLKLYRP